MSDSVVDHTAAPDVADRRPALSDRAFTALSRWGTIGSLVVLIIVFTVLRPDSFATSDNFFNILNQVAILGMLALGLTVALSMGLFDLSIAGMATLGGYLATKWLADGLISNAWLVLVIVLGIAALIGVLNGVLVSYLGISAFIETLAMGSILTGAVLGVSESQTVLSGIPQTFLDFGQGKVGPVPNPVVFLILVAVLLYVFLEQTEPGRHMYAIGSNSEAARLSGIPVRRYAMIALGIAATCAALGGMVVAANLGVGRPQGVGDTYLLDAFAAAFIGASTLRPGRFHILGTVIGVLLIGVISNGLSLLGVETFWQYVVRGLLLLFAVFAAGFVTTRRK
ncbi:ABC transporter permease [Blastococcus saxobsidens]|uniref:ABC transporter permease n=1 Tax=Blastococcus saxobsidens TaxID=138336 RepID=A0A6L9VZJ3_9ACTN|nr:ABC transporter permease [Blastococcus saxobsidens]